MLKISIKLLGVMGLVSLLFTACSNKYAESIKVLPNEIGQANECKSVNKEFELDCYELIAYKNSIALIRLGIIDDAKGKYLDAFKKYDIAKKRGNFYANSLLADLYHNGKGVKQNKELALELLEEAESYDAISAYKLAYLEINKKDRDNDDIIKLLTFAANSELKQAQKLLSNAYRNGHFGLVKDVLKAQEWNNRYLDKEKNLIKNIYGI
jgi:TPR repeat protein